VADEQAFKYEGPLVDL